MGNSSPNPAPSPEGLNHWIKANIATILTALTMLAAVYASYVRHTEQVSNLAQRAERNYALIEKMSEKLELHMEDTARHADPQRDPAFQGELIKRLDRLEQKLDNQIGRHTQ